MRDCLSFVEGLQVLSAAALAAAAGLERELAAPRVATSANGWAQA
jgi:hypothetical protein